MPIQVLMPALSPTMTEGNLAKWHVKEGDQITSESLGRSAGRASLMRMSFTIESTGAISNTTNRESWLNSADPPRGISMSCPDPTFLTWSVPSPIPGLT